MPFKGFRYVGRITSAENSKAYSCTKNDIIASFVCRNLTFKNVCLYYTKRLKWSVDFLSGNSLRQFSSSLFIKKPFDYKYICTYHKCVTRMYL